MQAESGKRVSILAVSLLVSACGGGGGSGTVPTTPFTSWSTVPPTSTVIVNGLGQQSTYDYDPATKRVSNIVPGDVSQDYSAQLTFDAGVLIGLKLVTPTASLSFASNEIFDLPPEVVGATNRTSNALLANPVTLGWDYQTFGVWETGLDTDSGSFGAMSVGAASPGIPAGDATFVGRVGGSWVDANGKGHAVLADLEVGLSGQSLSLTTTNTRVSEDWRAFSTNTDLDIVDGTLTITGTNGFTGTLTTASGLTGESTGQFYGPNAEELGGVFFLVGGGQTYSGAYGATSVP